MKIIFFPIGGRAESCDEQRFPVVRYCPITLGGCSIRMFLGMVPGMRGNRSKRKDESGAGHGSFGTVQSRCNRHLRLCAIDSCLIKGDSDAILTGDLDTNHRELPLRRPTVIGFGVIFFPCSYERIVCRPNVRTDERTGESKEQNAARGSHAFCWGVHRQSRTIPYEAHLGHYSDNWSQAAKAPAKIVSRCDA
jgi:hypothetical protein